MTRKTISVTGMACGGCEESVEDALSAIEGVDDVKANNETDSVEVELGGDVDDGVLHSTIEDAGFDVAG